METAMLNIGCGSRFCSESLWTNIDFFSANERVIACNLLKGIPFPSQTFDVVYHSHILEHFTKNDAEKLIKECYRVLKPGGIIRVVLPNLENICRVYLEALEKLTAGHEEWIGKYDWILLEMYDQAVRTVPDGEMGKYLLQPDIPDREFIIERAGNMAREKKILKTSTVSSKKSSLWKRAVVKARRTIYNFRRFPSRVRRSIIESLLDENQLNALEIGSFRLQGEIHQWMYDRYSLKQLLEKYGFKEVKVCTAIDSSIKDWDKYLLDINSDGTVHAPASLFMEGVK
ncbi:MAG: methyltransferase domain-containing protein [Bacteroidetes bacterium]|nr:methyltransferase domain-containing protein [Bacteroidota bacterium]